MREKKCIFFIRLPFLVFKLMLPVFKLLLNSYSIFFYSLKFLFTILVFLEFSNVLNGWKFLYTCEKCFDYLIAR